MATEVSLRPGWLLKDVQRAAGRVQQWSVRSSGSDPRSSSSEQPLNSTGEERPAPTSQAGPKQR